METVIIFALAACLAISVAANYVQYQDKLDLTEKLYEATGWIDPVYFEEGDNE